ncbi:hypothetical protein F383_35983 [Gossypium arboreum]|uniref:Uncharacterized protein n=1 Tax=Gossypium arboreum TaxID=29729 RepID=A0A0B0PXT7_GOSAR|nr:hypothetical protein F383_35983 [Gossypium arboreum]
MNDDCIYYVKNVSDEIDKGNSMDKPSLICVKRSCMCCSKALARTGNP